MFCEVSEAVTEKVYSLAGRNLLQLILERLRNNFKLL